MHVATFYYTLRATEIDMVAGRKRYDPTTMMFCMPRIGVNDEYISLFLLILLTYGLEDEGDICWIDNVLVVEVREAYKQWWFLLRRLLI